MKKNLKPKELSYTPAPTELLPPGPERDFRRILWLNTCWNSQATTVERWNKALKLIEEEKTYERYPPENPAGTIDVLVKTLYGISIEESRKQLGKHGGDRKSEGRNQDANRHVVSIGQNHAEYLTARIARDRPDILERLDNKEFRSVREAAIEAGIVKPTKKISLDAENPAKAAATVIRALRDGKISEFYIQQLMGILLHNKRLGIQKAVCL